MNSEMTDGVVEAESSSNCDSLELKIHGMSLSFRPTATSGPRVKRPAGPGVSSLFKTFAEVP